MGLDFRKLLWGIFNVALFAGWGVFSGYYIAARYGYLHPNVLLAIVVMAAVFALVCIVANIFHQLGHAAFIRFLGLKVNYFEACLFIWRFDGERGRVKIGGGIGSLFSGTVFVRVTGGLDTRALYDKNAADYRKTFLGGPAFNALVLLAVIAYVAATAAVSRGLWKLEPVSIAFALASWYILYGALSESGKKRGDMLTYFKYKADSEAQLLGLASQSIVETPADALMEAPAGRFLLDEAQKLIKLRLGANVDCFNRQTMNIVGFIALTNALKEYPFLPEVKEFATGLTDADTVAAMEPAAKYQALGRSRMLICALLIEGDIEAASAALETFAGLASALRVRDPALMNYFADMRLILKERDEETLAATDFLNRDSYGKLFNGYSALIDRADGAAHQSVFRYFDEHKEEAEGITDN